MKKSFFVCLFVLGSMLHPRVGSGEELGKEAIPIVSTMGPVSVANLNLNRRGNTIFAKAGEKIFSTLNFSFDADSSEPESLYQIVIGYAGIGPQKCIFNELGYRFAGEEGILSFFCQVPEVAGIYDIECLILSESSSSKAVKSWWDHSSLEEAERVKVGRIIVK